MKRLSHVLAAFVMCVCLASPTLCVRAAEKNAWVEVDTTASDTVKAEVLTNGSSVDGLIKLTYDAEALKVSEENVVVSSDVEMYALNLDEDGVIAFSYLAKEEVKKGTLVTISFEKEKDVTLDSFQLTGTMYTASGKALPEIVKQAQAKEIKPATPNKSGNTTTPTKNDKDDTTTVAPEGNTTTAPGTNGSVSGTTGTVADDKDTGATTDTTVEEATETVEASADTVESTDDKKENTTESDEKVKEEKDNEDEEEGSHRTVIVIAILVVAVLLLAGAVVVARKKK